MAFPEFNSEKKNIELVKKSELVERLGYGAIHKASYGFTPMGYNHMRLIWRYPRHFGPRENETAFRLRHRPSLVERVGG